MFGVFFSYKDDTKKHLIERFKTKQEALNAKSKYIIDDGETVTVKPL